MRLSAKTIVLATVLCGSGVTWAEKSPTDISLQLPEKLQGLLIQEMNAITQACQVIVKGLVTGEHVLVAEQAQAIHDSFIFAKAMTPQDHEIFHKALPHDFIERDQALHSLSADLAQAARQRDQAAQHKLFSQMLETCVECHAHYARQRFPSLPSPLAPTSEASGHFHDGHETAPQHHH